MTSYFDYDFSDAPTRAECEAAHRADELREACMEDEEFVELERMEEFLDDNKPTDLADLRRIIAAQKKEIEDCIIDAESCRRDPMKYYGLREGDFR